MAEADDIVAACEQHGVKFNYGAQRRYMSLYHRLRELVAGGEIGEVRGITAHTAPSSAQWGLTHTSDMLLLLAGDPTIELVQSTVDLGRAWSSLATTSRRDPARDLRLRGLRQRHPWLCGHRRWGRSSR